MSAIHVSEPLADAVSIEALAEWYTEHLPEFERQAALMRNARVRLDGYVKEFGPLATAHGRLEVLPDGYAYDEDAIAAEFPAIVTRMEILLGFASVENAERVLSITLEECPDTEIVSTKRSIDKAAAARMVKAGGRAGERMGELRRQRGRLGVAK